MLLSAKSGAKLLLFYKKTSNSDRKMSDFFVISKIMRTFATQKGVYASTGIMARETAAVSKTEIITNKR